MASLIAPVRVIPVLRARNLRQLVESLTRVAAAAASLDHTVTHEAVLARGESSSFAFGRGVALPHAMVGGLGEPLGVFARLDPALHLDAPDAMPVDLVALILSPKGDHATLLRALACVVRRLRDRDVAERLRSAVGVEAIHSVLTSDSWRGEVDGQDPPGAPAPYGEDLTNAAKWPTIGPSC